MVILWGCQFSATIANGRGNGGCGDEQHREKICLESGDLSMY